MRLLPATLLATLLCLAPPAPAQAWSRQGHQLVGELAEAELSPAAQAEVRRLLAGEPEPTLAGVSTWADEIRAADTELGRRSARWHYLNLPTGGCDYQPARDCPDGECVIGAIHAQLAILSDRTRDDEARRQALKFLVHFVGDVHQPMHAGYREDRGGNNYQVSYRGPGARQAGGEGSNLHGVWDYWLLQSAGLDNDAYLPRLQALPLPGPATPDPALPARAWALESCALIRAESLYPRTHVVDARYVERLRPVAEARLRLAGHRLAVLLNGALARGD